MRYGVPYQGNKSPIADWLAEQIPSAENFYDMFAGGFAVTHRMVLERRHRRFFANDINALSCRLFSDCVNGRAPKARWVSHEDFDRLKMTDGYAACCFSFGSDWQSYIYSSVLEPLKRALHHAIVDLDFTETDALGIDLHYIAERPTIHARMLAVRKVVKNRGGELQHLERLQNLERLESFERLQNLTRLNTLDRFDSLAITSRTQSSIATRRIRVRTATDAGLSTTRPFTTGAGSRANWSSFPNTRCRMTLKPYRESTEWIAKERTPALSQRKDYLSAKTSGKCITT